MSLRQKTISGLKWSFLGNAANYGIQFVFGLVLARLLDPKDWGLIGMLTFFIAISQVFIDSGFNSALIRKSVCSAVDYSTVFFFNIVIGLLCYLVLFFAAGPIGIFFKEPQLVMLLRVLGLVLLINAVTVIQGTLLTKKVNFKLLTKISIIAALSSGILSVILAYKGLGVWSLVIRMITQSIVTSALLWIWNRWLPVLSFSKASFREMFGFGSKLLLSSLIYTTYRNVYYLVIGKFFSAVELGHYTRAENFSKPASSNLTSVIQRVSYPVLSSLQNDALKLKTGYQKLIKGTMFITFVLLIGLAAVAKPLVIVLIGSKWLPAVPYLQLMCFASMLYPLHALNLNVLNVKGRSDLFLKMEVIKTIFALPNILFGVLIGIKAMIAGMIVTSIMAYFLNSYFSARLIDYSTREQLRDITPSLAIALTMGIVVFVLGLILPFRPGVVLFMQITAGAACMHLLSAACKLDIYFEIKKIVAEQLNGLLRRSIQNESA